MNKFMISSVLALSILLRGTYVFAESEIDTSFVNGYEEDITYKDEVVIKVGGTVTLDDLELYNPNGVSFEPFEKNYDKFGTYNEKAIDEDGNEYPFKVYVEAKGALKIVGAKDITVIEGEKFDILSGVLTTKKSTIKVSKFDKTLIDVVQNVKITAKTDTGEVATAKIKLYIKNKPVKFMKKYVYARCKVNMHTKPAYKSKNIGTIPYNTKISVTGKVKVGKFNWYRIKHKNKVGYVFTKATSSKKLPNIKKGFHVVTDADIDLETQQDDEDMRESGKIDHNGNIVVDRGWIKQPDENEDEDE